MKEPAHVRVAAPKSLAGLVEVPADLAAAFAPPGYALALDGAALIVTRSGKVSLSNDPGALAPLIDAPFAAQEQKNLAGLVAAYEAGLSGE